MLQDQLPTRTKIMQENKDLLDHVIANARLKGARIESWQYSKNNRVILHEKGTIPAYYFSVTAATDHLIYQYKLIKIYSEFYNNINPIQNKKVAKSDKPKLLPEDVMIQKCDNLFLESNNDININIKRKIYQFISQTYVPNKVTYDNFYLIHTALLDHYRNFQFNEGYYGKKTRLKNLIQLIEKMSYTDFHDLF